MIVRPRPGALQLFFILRGSILPKIAAKILFISLLACVTVWFYERGELQSLRNMSAPAFSLLGVALSVFPGFSQQHLLRPLVGGPQAVGRAGHPQPGPGPRCPGPARR